MERQDRLLIRCLDLDKPHRRPRDGFADRRRIRGIGFAALDIGLHINRRDQPYFMTQLEQFPRPVVAGAAGLDPDQARIKAFKEPQHLRASKGPIERDLTAIRDAVNLKNVLGQIQADCCNVHWVAPLLSSS